MKQFELQPLRLSSGWTVKYNDFSEYDFNEDGQEYLYELKEDLLQLENQNLIIDLGWYPSMDITGRYILYLIDKNADKPFDDPIDVIESRSKQDILSKLEYWTNYGFYQKYIR